MKLISSLGACKRTAPHSFFQPFEQKMTLAALPPAILSDNNISDLINKNASFNNV